MKSYEKFANAVEVIVIIFIILYGLWACVGL